MRLWHDVLPVLINCMAARESRTIHSPEMLQTLLTNMDECWRKCVPIICPSIFPFHPDAQGVNNDNKNEYNFKQLCSIVQKTLHYSNLWSNLQLLAHILFFILCLQKRIKRYAGAYIYFIQFALNNKGWMLIHTLWTPGLNLPRSLLGHVFLFPLTLALFVIG